MRQNSHPPLDAQGEFAANQYAGHGTYTFPDGSTYEGAFKDGQMHGAGCFVDKQARPSAQRVLLLARCCISRMTTHLSQHSVATASRRPE